MRSYLFRIMQMLGFWYLMSPFILKTAKALPARGAGVLIGTLVIICAIRGFKTGRSGWAYALRILGIASIVFGIVGGRHMHFGGTFHDILLGIVFIILSVIVLRYPHVPHKATSDDQDKVSYDIDSQQVVATLSQMTYAQVRDVARAIMRGNTSARRK